MATDSSWPKTIRERERDHSPESANSEEMNKDIEREGKERKGNNHKERGRIQRKDTVCACLVRAISETA